MGFKPAAAARQESAALRTSELDPSERIGSASLNGLIRKQQKIDEQPSCIIEESGPVTQPELCGTAERGAPPAYMSPPAVEDVLLQEKLRAVSQWNYCQQALCEDSSSCEGCSSAWSSTNKQQRCSLCGHSFCDSCVGQSGILPPCFGHG